MWPSKPRVQTHSSDFLLSILPPSADSAWISVKHTTMSLARPVVGRPALISLGTNYWPLHGYWSHFSLNPSVGFQESLPMSWISKASLLKDCIGLCQSGIVGFPFSVPPRFVSPRQTERIRRLYPQWLHGLVHLKQIFLSPSTYDNWFLG